MMRSPENVSTPPAAPRKTQAAQAVGEAALSRKGRGMYSGLKKTTSRPTAKSGMTSSSHAHFMERALQFVDGLTGSGTFRCPDLLAISTRARATPQQGVPTRDLALRGAGARVPARPGPGGQCGESHMNLLPPVSHRGRLPEEHGR